MKLYAVPMLDKQTGKSSIHEVTNHTLVEMLESGRYVVNGKIEERSYTLEDVERHCERFGCE